MIRVSGVGVLAIAATLLCSASNASAETRMLTVTGSGEDREAATVISLTSGAESDAKVIASYPRTSSSSYMAAMFGMNV